MNEITRIHLAKVAYDIEISAKKQLEKYLKSLDEYTNDEEVKRDIEIRMTEILAERGVAANGVITDDDVAALREQLGEPYEFADESGDAAIGTDSTQAYGNERKLYRSTDNAVLGGVLSGFAVYFKVDVLWLRLAFILLIFMSAGFAVLLYLVLWIVMPPALTVTQKLQQTGKPVTVDSIRQMNETDGASTSASTVAPVVKRTLTITMGVINALISLGVLIAILLIIVGASTSGVVNEYGSAYSAPFAWTVYGIIVFGLALLALLFGLIAYAFFAQKLTKRLLVSAVAVVVLGIASVTIVVSMVGFQQWRTNTQIQDLMRTTKTTLPADFSKVKSLTIANKNHESFTHIRYVVSGETPRYELSALPGVSVRVTVDDAAATVSVTEPLASMQKYVASSSTLTLYGPALDTINNNVGSSEYTPTSQEHLAVQSSDEGALTISSGIIETLTVSGSGSVDATAATVSQLVTNSKQSLSVSAGTVRELTVSQPEACPSGANERNLVTVEGVTSNVVRYNNTEQAAKTYKTNCSQIVIGDDSDYDDNSY